MRNYWWFEADQEKEISLRAVSLIEFCCFLLLMQRQSTCHFPQTKQKKKLLVVGL